MVGCDLRDSCFSPHMDGDRVSSSVRLPADRTTAETQVATRLTLVDGPLYSEPYG
jgi:hypothetical protein